MGPVKNRVVEPGRETMGAAEQTIVWKIMMSTCRQTLGTMKIVEKRVVEQTSPVGAVEQAIV